MACDLGPPGAPRGGGALILSLPASLGCGAEVLPSVSVGPWIVSPEDPPGQVELLRGALADGGLRGVGLLMALLGAVPSEDVLGALVIMES